MSFRDDKVDMQLFYDGSRIRTFKNRRQKNNRSGKMFMKIDLSNNEV